MGEGKVGYFESIFWKGGAPQGSSSEQLQGNEGTGLGRGVRIGGEEQVKAL
jgi:hypothetical protein